jgi:hypothetical protein
VRTGPAWHLDITIHLLQAARAAVTSEPDFPGRDDVLRYIDAAVDTINTELGRIK